MLVVFLDIGQVMKGDWLPPTISRRSAAGNHIGCEALDHSRY